MGNLELEAIEGVLAALGKEAADDLFFELRWKRDRAERDHVQKFKEAMALVEERLRKQDIPNPKIARNAIDVPDGDNDA